MGRVSVHCSGTLTRLCTKGPATSGRSLTSGQWSVTKLFPFYSLSSHSISGFARVCHIQVMLQENANVLLEGKAFPRWPRVETFFHFREVWICWNLRRWRSMKFTGLCEFAESTVQISTVLLQQLSKTGFDQKCSQMLQNFGEQKKRNEKTRNSCRGLHSGCRKERTFNSV